MKFITAFIISVLVLSILNSTILKDLDTIFMILIDIFVSLFIFKVFSDDN